jgi:hypothetical protein
MRWTTQPAPCDGDVREVRRFAFLPVRTHDGRCVWLESYVTVERFTRTVGLFGDFSVWETVGVRIGVAP